jgi:hypothetical protein
LSEAKSGVRWAAGTVQNLPLFPDFASLNPGYERMMHGLAACIFTSAQPKTLDVIPRRL